jgi:hypothetical protein
MRQPRGARLADASHPLQEVVPVVEGPLAARGEDARREVGADAGDRFELGLAREIHLERADRRRREADDDRAEGPVHSGGA